MLLLRQNEELNRRQRRKQRSIGGWHGWHALRSASGRATRPECADPGHLQPKRHQALMLPARLLQPPNVLHSSKHDLPTFVRDVDARQITMFGLDLMRCQEPNSWKIGHWNRDRRP